MGLRWRLLTCAVIAMGVPSCVAHAQSSSSSKPARKSQPANSPLDAGSVQQGTYGNKSLGMTCVVPGGWVLRTEEMNSAGDAKTDVARQNESPADTSPSGETTSAVRGDAKVLLAAFSRPPEARGSDVNSSILIAAEGVAAYPGLKEAVQYMDPVTEVAKARGFRPVEEPYEFAVGSKRLVRADFQKDVGTRVMRQSTLVLLARGYALSLTFIAGTEDEIDELIAGVEFREFSHGSSAGKSR